MKVSQDKLKELICLYRDHSDNESYYIFLKEVDEYVRKVLFAKISNKELLEDTCQDVMLAIHKSLHTYDIKESFFPWLNSIIFHKTIDFYRKQSRLSTWEDIQEQDLSSGEISMEDRITVREVLEVLSKEVFGMKFLEQKLLGLSIDEIAASIGLSKSNTKVKMHRIAKKVRKGFL